MENEKTGSTTGLATANANLVSTPELKNFVRTSLENGASLKYNQRDKNLTATGNVSNKSSKFSVVLAYHPNFQLKGQGKAAAISIKIDGELREFITATKFEWSSLEDYI